MTEENLSEEDRALRNSIFAAKQAAEQSRMPPGGSPFSPQNQVNQNPLTVEIPYGDVQLPSKGLIYPPESPFHNKQTIAIRAMTTKDENILMNTVFIKRGTMIDELIKACVLDKASNVNLLVSGDKMAIMTMIRVSGYGANYETKVSCPKCEVSTDQQIGLNCPIKELDLTKLNQVRQFENLFEFTLPVSKRKVHFKFLTGQDEQQINEIIDGKKKKGILSTDVMTTRLAASIVSVDGHTNRQNILGFVEAMSPMDSVALRKHMIENEPSIELTFPFSCDNCGHTQEMMTPLGPSFFYPGS